MIIPMPRFEPVTLDLSGLNVFQKIRIIIKTPPRFKLTENWTVTLDDGLQLVFPEGFVTDFASVPRFLWFIPGFSPYGPLLCGSIPHDFGYQHDYFLTPFSESGAYPKKSKVAFESGLFTPGLVPVFIGRNQEFFDRIMEGIVKETTGANFVASIAKKVLSRFGHVAWNNYRKNGPGAYGINSLKLPGVNLVGEVV